MILENNQVRGIQNYKFKNNKQNKKIKKIRNFSMLYAKRVITKDAIFPGAKIRSVQYKALPLILP